MYKIAAVGDRESVYAFAALGISVFPVEEGDDAGRVVDSLAKDGYAVIYVTENIAGDIGVQLERYRSTPLPSLILIPGIKGNTGQGMADVHKSVEKAVGSDIL